MRMHSFIGLHLCRKALCCLLAILMVLAFSPISSFAQSADGLVVHAESDGSLPNVASRSHDEIRSFMNSHKFDLYSNVIFDQNPSLTGTMVTGKLSTATLNEALNAVNVMRYIAGLDANVTLDSSYSEKAQAGSFVNALNNTLSHNPTRPTGISDDLYNLGYAGCGQSNLSAGRINPAASVVFGYMNDSDDSNIDRVGHRRWVLNPKMGKTGFGFVNAPGTKYTYWSAMYALDSSSTQASQTNVVWPAQNMPIDYFSASQAWSISTGTIQTAANVKVVLTRQSDGRSWTFSSTSSDGDFFVENNNYGQKGCIIFRPSGLDSIADDDIFRVQAEGISTPLDYYVNFFRADPLSAYTRVHPYVFDLEFTYNGKYHMPVGWTTGYSVIGDKAGKDAGEYKFTMMLDEGYIWDDGTFEPKKYSWRIKKAAKNISLGNVTFQNSTVGAKQVIAVPADGWSAVSATSSSNSVVSTRITGIGDSTKLELTAVSPGTATVTVKATGGNYLDTTTTFKVTVPQSSNGSSNSGQTNPGSPKPDPTPSQPTKLISQTIKLNKKVYRVSAKKLRKQPLTARFNVSSDSKKFVRVINSSKSIKLKKFKVKKVSNKRIAITIPKGCKRGVYLIKIKIQAPQTSIFKATTKTVSLKIILK